MDLPDRPFFAGKLHYRSIALGAVTGCLVAGLVIGAQVKVQIDGTVKNLFFTLFLFALGYKVGPQFFRGLRKDGLPQVLNAVIVAVTGLLVCWLFASMLGYGPGLSAGLLSGALTQSAAIGTASDAIANLPGLSAAQVQQQQNLVAVGYAVCYPLGTILCAVLLANVLPKLYHCDLAAESAELSKELDTPDDDPDTRNAYEESVLRAYTVDHDELVGKTIDQFEQDQKQHGRRIYITRVRRGGTIIHHTQDTVLQRGRRRGQRPAPRPGGLRRPHQYRTGNRRRHPAGLPQRDDARRRVQRPRAGPHDLRTTPAAVHGRGLHRQALSGRVGIPVRAGHQGRAR
ncbi:cation:proton antiporter [Branchiibius cervicis]|uniref:Cation:proton antiporter n=1 Tax=Branchiibius cervicis TaxID=908252 RepID=A0ABW2ANH9_9MICO